MSDGALAAAVEADAACALGSPAAALVVAVAAAAHGGDPGTAAVLPRIGSWRLNALYLAADDRGDVAPIGQFLALAGTRPTPVGFADACPDPLLKAALRDAAVLVLVGTDRAARARHLHAARAAGVAAIVRAADRDDAVAALDAGAALVCFKTTNGLGVLAGAPDLIAAARVHAGYLGRLAPAAAERVAAALCSLGSPCG